MPRFVLIIASLFFCAIRCAASEPFGQVLYIAPDVYNGVVVKESDSSRAALLFEQAQQAAEEGQASRALQLASESLSYEPDHASARAVIGYEQVDGIWMTSYQREQSERGYAWDKRYGWVRPEELPQLEAGERPVGKRWVSLEVDQRKHNSIDDGWQVRTDHFLVTTNHSPEAGVALAAELEGLFQVWRQLFAAYYLDAREIRQRFAGERSARKARRPMKVFYHRDKAEYVEYLKRRQPRIDETLGIYFDTIRQSHFFHSDDPTEAAMGRATLYHEAVHQLFQETTRKARSPGENANFWVIEGVACYFESLQIVGEGRYVIGPGGRLASAAKVGLVVPTAELAALGQSDLQRQGNLAEIYAQSAGLVAMLMHENDGRDREPLANYLREVYSRRPDGEALSRELNRLYGVIDAEYGRFLSKTRDNLLVE